jgi:hypothetical protein
MKKRLKLVALLAILMMVMVLPLGAAPNVTVKVDGVTVAFPDQKPYIDSANRTLVPMRAPMEALGATVSWNNDTRQAIFEKDGVTAVFTIGSKTYTVNGVKKTMDTQAVITGDRTCIPIRFAAEAVGATVGWDPNTYTVLITTTEVKTVDLGWSDDPAKEDVVQVGDYNIFVSNQGVNDPNIWFNVTDLYPCKDIRVVCTSHPEWNQNNRLMWDGSRMVMPQDVWKNSFMFFKDGYSPTNPKSGDRVTFDIYGKVNGQETLLVTITKTLP